MGKGRNVTIDEADSFDWGIMRNLLEMVIDEKGIQATGQAPQPIQVDEETNDKLDDMF